MGVINVYKDLVGKTFGRLLVIQRIDNVKGRAAFLCQCSCGKYKNVPSIHLTTKHTQSCGCLNTDKKPTNKKRKHTDLTGKIFDNILVLRFIERKGTENPTFVYEVECQCGCKKKSFLYSYQLKRKEFLKACAKWSMPLRTEKFSHVKNSILNSYKEHAIKKNIEFNLSIEDIENIITKPCYYCGNKHSNHRNGKSNGSISYNGLDRIDSKKGYLKTNILPTCKYCNFAKNDFTQDEFYHNIIKIYNYQKLNNKIDISFENIPIRPIKTKQKQKQCCGNSLPPLWAAQNRLFAQYKTGAKERKKSFNLTFDQFLYLTQQNCAYCGIKPSRHHIYRVNGDFYFNGIDRINSKEGYEIGNVNSCCSECNYIKQHLSIEEFLTLVNNIVKNLELK